MGWNKPSCDYISITASLSVTTLHNFSLFEAPPKKETLEILEAYYDKFRWQGDYNVIIVAWGAGAAAPDYNQAVSNTRMVATQTRLIIEGLVQAGGRLADIHIIGHSLGAHTAGSTGRQMDGKVGRITGKMRS